MTAVAAPNTANVDQNASNTEVAQAGSAAAATSGVASLIGSIGQLFALGINNGTQAANDAASQAQQNYEISQEQNNQLQKLLQG